MKLYIGRKWNTTQSHITLEQHIFTLPQLPSVTDEHESTAKSIMSLTVLASVTFTILGIWRDN